MKSFETLRTWLIIGGLLLFSGLASLGWIVLSAQDSGDGLDLARSVDVNLALDPGEPITIQLDQYLLGEVLVDAPVISRLQGAQVPALLAAAILAAAVVGGLLVVGLPLAFIYVRLDRQAEQVKEDPEFQEQRAALEKKEAERLRAHNDQHPPAPTPSHQMPRWAVASTGLIILFFVILIGFTLGDTFYPGGEVALTRSIFVRPALVISAVLGIIALIAMAGAWGMRRGAAESREDSRIPWGAIWVALTGFIFLGIGTGLMIAIRSAGG
ncbi:MAG TPA: hypothetical protein VE553_09220 [Candidatus Binatia bacterium]|nr:hypothetical protein [Candidatus Binatia bacterium]